MNRPRAMRVAGAVGARLWTLPPSVLFIPFNYQLP
jgi:hypothetical protein